LEERGVPTRTGNLFQDTDYRRARQAKRIIL
jgi:hypothetical protein